MSGTPTVDGAEFFNLEQSENDFMRHVIAYAKARGWLVYHTHIAKRSTEGFPDLTMVRAGRLVFAELKREKGGRVSPAQQTWLEELREVRDLVRERDYMQSHKGPEDAWDDVVGVYLWRPSDWPQIEKVLA